MTNKEILEQLLKDIDNLKYPKSSDDYYTEGIFDAENMIVKLIENKIRECE